MYGCMHSSVGGVHEAIFNAQHPVEINRKSELSSYGAHVFTLNTWEATAGGSLEVKASLDYTVRPSEKARLLSN